MIDKMINYIKANKEEVIVGVIMGIALFLIVYFNLPVE